MTNFTGLMQRLLEVQSGERQRSPELMAEDERLMDGLWTKALTGERLHQAPARMVQGAADEVLV